MTSATIQFACPQCGKKYSTPASLAGKALNCGCGSKISIPSVSTAPAAAPQTPALQPAAPVQSSYQPPVATTSVGPPPGFSISTSTPAGVGQAITTTGSGALRREFPALKFVAKITDIISWIYIVGGLLAAVGVVVSAGVDAFPWSLFGAIAVALLVMLVAVFIRAMAEMIRLALYLAELLEDVRANTRRAP